MNVVKPFTIITYKFYLLFFSQRWPIRCKFEKRQIRSRCSFTHTTNSHTQVQSHKKASHRFHIMFQQQALIFLYIHCLLHNKNWNPYNATSTISINKHNKRLVTAYLRIVIQVSAPLSESFVASWKCLASAYLWRAGSKVPLSKYSYFAHQKDCNCFESYFMVFSLPFRGQLPNF